MSSPQVIEQEEDLIILSGSLFTSPPIYREEDEAKE